MSRQHSGAVDEGTVHERNLERERSEHFRALPGDVQGELRGCWRAEERRFGVRHDDRRRFRLRSAGEGAALLVVGRLLFSSTVPGLFLAAVLGGIVGLVWFQFRAQRFTCIAIVLPAWLLLTVASPTVSFAPAMFEGVYVVAGSAMMGVFREFRRGDSSVM